MGDFFEFPEPEPESPRASDRPQPAWFTAPRGVLPGVVPLELMLARSERAVVAVTVLEVYPVGFGFDLLVLASDEDDELDPMLMGHIRHRGQHQRDAQRDMLRFGLQFANGERVMNTLGREIWQSDEPPASPVLRTQGGHAGGGEWKQQMWVWPLPPPGKLTFACEWPVAGIELTLVEVDAQLVIEAATRSLQTFEGTADGDGAYSHRSSFTYGRGSS